MGARILRQQGTLLGPWISAVVAQKAMGIGSVYQHDEDYLMKTTTNLALWRWCGLLSNYFDLLLYLQNLMSNSLFHAKKHQYSCYNTILLLLLLVLMWLPCARITTVKRFDHWSLALWIESWLIMSGSCITNFLTTC